MGLVPLHQLAPTFLVRTHATMWLLLPSLSYLWPASEMGSLHCCDQTNLSAGCQSTSCFQLHSNLRCRCCVVAINTTNTSQKINGMPSLRICADSHLAADFAPFHPHMPYMLPLPLDATTGKLLLHKLGYVLCSTQLTWLSRNEAPL
jgi:hypothetical protein